MNATKTIRDRISYEMEFMVPIPFRFNPWKHHLKWVYSYIEFACKSEHLLLKDDILRNIKAINSNPVEIYTGLLSPNEIIQYVTNQLDILKITNKKELLVWLNQIGFQLLTLHDSSVWVVREGIENERYVHIHPARNSPNTLRIHGNSWKTAMTAKLFGYDISKITLPDINNLRKNYLNLSSIKNLERSHRLHISFELLT